MSQPISLKKLENSKRLKEARLRMNLKQTEMGKLLGLDPTYISQMENGRVEVDDWYVTQAEEALRKHENSKSGTLSDEGSPHAGERAGQIAQECREYLDRVLDSCAGDEKLLSWTLVELQNHFLIRTPPKPPELERGGHGKPPIFEKGKLSSEQLREIAERVERAEPSAEPKRPRPHHHKHGKA